MLAPAPSRKILRRMDYISDQKGILRRYLREFEGWNEHIRKSGNFITEVLQSNEFNHVVVLGSGWLLDFPIENMLNLVRKITLVDINFPSQILRKVENLEGVECVRADITGGFIESVYEQLNKSPKEFSIPENINPPHISPEKGKLIISLNILNQLDILLADYILQKARTGEEYINLFRKTLQEEHIRMLKEHPFILITDYREILINTKGQILEEKELIFTELPSGGHEKEWEWQFDTHQLYHENANTHMKVRAMYSRNAPPQLPLKRDRLSPGWEGAKSQ
jgi:hypothetical protein